MHVYKGVVQFVLHTQVQLSRKLVTFFASHYFNFLFTKFPYKSQGWPFTSGTCFHDMATTTHFFLITTIFLFTGLSYVSPSFMIGILLTLLLLVLLPLVFVPYIKEWMSNDDQRPPVVGPISNQLIYFRQLYDYLTSLAKKYPTFRFITVSHSEVYTVDPVNVEYILKTNFSNYTKVLLICFKNYCRPYYFKLSQDNCPLLKVICPPILPLTRITVISSKKAFWID